MLQPCSHLPKRQTLTQQSPHIIRLNHNSSCKDRVLSDKAINRNKQCDIGKLHFINGRTINNEISYERIICVNLIDANL